LHYTQRVGQTGFPWVKIEGEPSITLWGELDVKPQ
jgi:hypothetical protein